VTSSSLGSPEKYEYEPVRLLAPEFDRLSDEILEPLRHLRGLSATASDVLDGLGWQLAVASSVIGLRQAAPGQAVGHALTLRYVPERLSVAATRQSPQPSKLAHNAVFRLARRGDVLVVEAPAGPVSSVMGGRAASEAARRGLSGAIVDGGIRDTDEMREAGFPVWSRYVTPVTGKSRLEAIEANAPVACGGVQVVPGDLVLADETGVVFVPLHIADEVIAAILRVAEAEAGDLFVA
jgi:4-hydroxy-4-methyl-2-oxoglutarate aldolase